MAPDGEPIKRRPSMLSKALRGSQLRILANVYPSFGLPGTRVLPNHLGAKGTPSAFLRMTCAPPLVPHIPSLKTDGARKRPPDRLEQPWF